VVELAIARTSPYALTPEPSTYWWCRCGHCDTQAFCNGSYQGGEFEPVKLEIIEPTKVARCGR
jgi:CDGSH-type Zn-finger protein